MGYYATPLEVRRMLGGLDDYTDDEIEWYIGMAERAVERLTNTCYAGKPCQTSGWEYHSVTKYRGSWIFGPGVPIQLNYYPVRQILEFEVFNGEDYENWLDKPRGRGTGWWWCECEYGTLFIHILFLRFGGTEVRVKYEYGHDELPAEVKELTLLYTARYMVTLDARREVIIQGGGFTSAKEMLDFFNKRIDELERQLQALKTISGTWP